MRGRVVGINGYGRENRGGRGGDPGVPVPWRAWLEH